MEIRRKSFPGKLHSFLFISLCILEVSDWVLARPPDTGFGSPSPSHLGEAKPNQHHASKAELRVNPESCAEKVNLLCLELGVGPCGLGLCSFNSGGWIRWFPTAAFHAPPPYKSAKIGVLGSALSKKGAQKF